MQIFYGYIIVTYFDEATTFGYKYSKMDLLNFTIPDKIIGP